MFSDIKNWYRGQLINTVIDALRKNGFSAHYAEDKERAKDLVLSLIPPNSSVGIGGSVTIRELQLPQILRERGFKVIEHWIKGLSREESWRVRREEIMADVFLSSVNAITLDGKLIAIDGAGNRVAALAFGPKKVIVVVGINKIVRNVEEGLWRSRNIAALMNAKRLGLSTPCVKEGICRKCSYPTSICRITLILEARPSFTDFHVVLVGEQLGF